MSTFRKMFNCSFDCVQVQRKIDDDEKVVFIVAIQTLFATYNVFSIITFSLVAAESHL